MRVENELNVYAKLWENTLEINELIYNRFEAHVDRTPYLKRHFDVITQNNLGFGEKAFRYLWELIVRDMPKMGDFLEIGVYKGSILALIQMISRELNHDIHSWGVTPLAPVGDKYSYYDDCNYLAEIERTFNLCGVSLNSTKLIRGLSTDPLVAVQIGLNLYDVIYIDGGHDYATVKNDLKIADIVLRHGGILVLDDAACRLNIATWRGHEEVSQAADDFFENNSDYSHLISVGHNRLWRKS